MCYAIYTYLHICSILCVRSIFAYISCHVYICIYMYIYTYIYQLRVYAICDALCIIRDYTLIINIPPCVPWWSGRAIGLT